MRIESVILADIDTRLNEETGDRVKYVSKGRKLANAVDFVGIQTAQLGQTQGFNLSKTVEMLRILYQNEKYLMIGDAVYEVKNISKAKYPTYMKLSCQEIDDAEIMQALEEWKNANLQ